MVRLLISLVVGGALFAFIGYQMGLFTSSDTVGRTSDTDAEASRLDLGDDLDKEPAPPKKGWSVAAGGALRDPIVFNAHLTMPDRLELSAPVPGKVLFVGAEMPEGLVQAAGVFAFVAPPLENITIPGINNE